MFMGQPPAVGTLAQADSVSIAIMAAAIESFFMVTFLMLDEGVKSFSQAAALGGRNAG